MACLTPIALTNEYRKKDGRWEEAARYVPCGKCAACLKARALQWTIRLSDELNAWNGKACFLTLTYADHMLPTDCYNTATLVKRHPRNFFKRLRKRVPKLKYYLVGEYGTKSQRPHYHAIVFGVDARTNYSDVLNSWSSFDPFSEKHIPIGSVYFGDVNANSISYVTGYVIKPGFNEYAKEMGIQTEFSSMSNGLGVGHLTEAKIRAYKNGRYYYAMPGTSGKRAPLPRYYREKIFDYKVRDIFQTIDDEGNIQVHNITRVDLTRYNDYKRWIRNSQKERYHDVDVTQIQEADRRSENAQLLKRQAL